jgi:hypothetical protein
MLFYADKYRRPMKEFLNRYMAQNQSLEKQGEELLRRTFERTVETIYCSIGQKAFRPKTAVNAAVVDAVMVAVASLEFVADESRFPGLKHAYECLIADKDFQAATTRSTADDDNVRKRLRIAKDAFAKLS